MTYENVSRHASPTFEIRFRMVEKEHLDLPPIVRIYDARTCRDEVFRGEAASWGYTAVWFGHKE